MPDGTATAGTVAEACYDSRSAGSVEKLLPVIEILREQENTFQDHPPTRHPCHCRGFRIQIAIRLAISQR
jgi:hypothetical protein